MLPKSIAKNATIIIRTPMRITMAGGGTDVLWYSRKRGGEWISAAIDRYIYILVKEFADPKKIKLTINQITPVVTNLKHLKNNIIRECLKKANILGGIEIHISSDVSEKSGLGGSGSLEVGLLHALHAYNGEKIKPLQLAQEASNIEINRLNRPVGPQDQYISALGGIKYFTIDKKGVVKYENLPISKITLNKLKKNLLFFSTKILHDTGKILTNEKEKAKHEKSSNVLKTLDEIKNIGQQAKSYLLAGNIDKFGKTFHNHWLAKKKLSAQVSNTKINKWYSKALKMGSLGGKIMGAGGGGWFVFYVNKNHFLFKKQMRKLGLVAEKVNFDWKGTTLLKTPL